MRTCAKSTSVCVLAMLGLLQQGTARAADLVIVSNQGAVPGLKEIAAAFSRASGHKVTVLLAEGDVLDQNLASGTADIVSQNPEPMEKLVESGKIVPGTVTP